MTLVRAGKAFEEQWNAAVERELTARKKIARLFDSPVIRSGNGDMPECWVALNHRWTPDADSE